MFSVKGYIQQMARTRYNQNMRFGKLKGEGKKMNTCVLFCGNYINLPLGIVMYSSLSEFRNPVTVYIVK